MYIALILLSGGKGLRMKAPVPKQYLPLGGKPIAQRSLDPFFHVSEISEYIVVAREEDRRHFSKSVPLIFASPGTRRQDSLKNGLQKVSKKITHVLVHDGARPFVSKQAIEALIRAGKNADGATLALRTKYTLRQVTANLTTKKLVERADVWEMQTPQIGKLSLLEKGLLLAEKTEQTVTDDVGLIELIGGKVQIVEGEERNLKVTTPFDYALAQSIYEKAL
ncbi:MAG: 2-C-methyl-D-erythritol 4-phosphate cytidylyltransferase [Chlamydiota bacterium]